ATTYILTPTGKVIGTPIEGAVDSGILFGLLKGLEDYKKGQLGF
ncbi:thioredoxin family protein, partial [Campylobacter jejuni]|nr:thioredoxin family protein [Campylobacter jejuni]